VNGGKNTLIIVLIFACGILAGVPLAVFFPAPPVQLPHQAVYTSDAPRPFGPYS
jgi:hypothetical protein